MNTEVELKLDPLHTVQQRVIRESKRFNVLCAGRQWGKTLLGRQLVTTAALAQMPTAWFSPSYKSTSDTWRDLKDTLRMVTTESNEQERRLVLAGGGSLEVWSLDNPDSGRGRQYSTVLIDEAAQVAALEYCWTRTIRPMLARLRGTAWFLSTPTGASNYFATLYRKGQGLFRGEWRS